MTETDHPDLASAYCTTTAAEAQTEVEVTTGATAQAVITNRYAPWRSLTITKQVTGGYGDTRRARLPAEGPCRQCGCRRPQRDEL